MENENAMYFADVKRKSFNKGWNAAVKKVEYWLNTRKASEATIEQFKQFMKE